MYRALILISKGDEPAGDRGVGKSELVAKIELQAQTLPALTSKIESHVNLLEES